MKKWLKRLLPVVMAVMLCFGSCLTAFAADAVCPNGMVVSGSYKTCFYRSDHDKTYLYISDEPLYVDRVNENNLSLMASGNVCLYIDGIHDSDKDEGTIAFNIENYLVITDANYDVYYDDGSLFFQAPSPILRPIVQEAEMEKTLEPILLILPIGLACLVGWIALRKALSHLQGVLHQA